MLSRGSVVFGSHGKTPLLRLTQLQQFSRLNPVAASKHRRYVTMADEWRKYSNEELNKQYRCKFWGNRHPPEEVYPHFLKTIIEESELARSSLDCELDVAYGPTENEKLDIFGAKSLPKDAPVFVYIHGGVWQREDCRRQQNAVAARSLVSAGAIVVVMGYEIIPQVRLAEIIRQARSAVAHVLKFAKERGSRGVYVGGTSAGGHLTACVMATQWSEFPDVDPTLLKGFVPINGLFDVRPMVFTYINDPMGMTEDEAWENSPDNYLDRIYSNCGNVKVKVAVGGMESPELIRQSKSFYKALTDGGIDSTYLEVPGMDHFSITEELRKPDYSLTKEIVALMGL